MENELEDNWLAEVLDQLPDREITIRFQDRSDGGLRIWSDDVPGLVLSGPNPTEVIHNLGPALSSILIQCRKLSGLE